LGFQKKLIYLHFNFNFKANKMSEGKEAVIVDMKAEKVGVTPEQQIQINAQICQKELEEVLGRHNFFLDAEVVVSSKGNFSRVVLVSKK